MKLYAKDKNIAIEETLNVFVCGLFAGPRVTILILVTSLIWVPIGIWIGLRRKIAQKVQPYAQMAAAFPVNLLYGVFGTLVVIFNQL